MSLSNNPTKQEVLNFVVMAMRKQGVLSYKVSEETLRKVCKYRSTDGTKCPVGHCIPDEDYREIFDKGGQKKNGLSVRAIGNNGYLAGNIAWMKEPSMLEFLTVLQSAHDYDSVKTVEDFELRLNLVIPKFYSELTVPPALQPETIQ